MRTKYEDFSRYFDLTQKNRSICFSTYRHLEKSSRDNTSKPILPMYRFFLLALSLSPVKRSSYEALDLATEPEQTF